MEAWLPVTTTPYFVCLPCRTLPTGVLYDLLAEDHELPWTLTVSMQQCEQILSSVLLDDICRYTDSTLSTVD